MGVKQLISDLVIFSFLRLPFWEAFSILMICGEMNIKLEFESSKLFLFLDMGVLVLLGTFMAFSPMYRKHAAQLAALLMLAHCFLEAKYHVLDQTFLYRILIRNIGNIVACLLVASGFSEDRKAKKTRYIHLCFTLLGILLLAQAYLLVTSDYEQQLLEKLFSSFKFSNDLYKYFLIPGLVFCIVATSFSYFLRGQTFNKAQFFALVYAGCLLLPSDYIASFGTQPTLFWACCRLLVSSVTTFCCFALLFFNYHNVHVH